MSILKVDTIQNISGLEKYLAAMRVNFNVTSTIATRSAGNVSSITDHGTGEHTINFATALASDDYSVGTAARRGSTNDDVLVSISNTTKPSASALRLAVRSGTNAVDADTICVTATI
jgi:hypothetical protein